MKTPLLSVCLITYNHSKYIQQAIESILMQQVNFDWELVVADDFSLDGTREILLEYKNKYPEFITLILQSKNVGPAKNWLDLIGAPKSKYIAYIEGDDYWLDSQKLQKQVDFLEREPGFSMVHSTVRGVDKNDHPVEIHEQKKWNHFTTSLDYRAEIFRPIAFSATLVYRNLVVID